MMLEWAFKHVLLHSKDDMFFSPVAARTNNSSASITYLVVLRTLLDAGCEGERAHGEFVSSTLMGSKQCLRYADGEIGDVPHGFHFW